MMENTTTVPRSSLAAEQSSRPAVFVAAALGLLILFAAGFAQPSLLHNAARDSRHAVSFPCH